MPTLPPIIFTAYANDAQQNLGYLNEEMREIRRILEKAEANGLCKHINRSNANIQDILDVFVTHRDKIAIFHFAGHADSYGLLVDGAKTMKAEGFADFIGQQQGLEMVFLNACATKAHAEELLHNNVKHALVTARSISDAVAKSFAIQFYKSLASGASIEKAFKEAKAGEHSKGGAKRDRRKKKGNELEEYFEWELFSREGATESRRWSLPAAVEDHLFGLPELGEEMLPENPFPNLQSFSSRYSRVYFGRGKEIRNLYMKMTDLAGPPIILVYGQSGAGKSSLLRAGLFPRLRRTQEVFYAQHDPSIPILETLHQKLKMPKDRSQLGIWWNKLEAQGKKAYSCIIDKIEEIFIHPTDNEVENFFDFLSLFSQKRALWPQGKLVLGLQKEYLPEVEKQLIERELPYSRVFIETLDKEGIEEIILGIPNDPKLQDFYGLEVEKGLASEIAVDLTSETNNASIAPTLQIFLSELWRKARNISQEKPRFTRELYLGLKRQGMGLEGYVKKQLGTITKEFRESGLALSVLYFHINTYGFAHKVAEEQLLSAYSHVSTQVKRLLVELKRVNLLVEANGDIDGKQFLRLAHDTLAAHITKRFKESDAKGQRAFRILNSRKNNGHAIHSHLSNADIQTVKMGIAGMRKIDEVEQQLLDESCSLIKKEKWSQRIKHIFYVTVLLLIFSIVWYVSEIFPW